MIDPDSVKDGMLIFAQLFGFPELVAAIDDGREFRWQPKVGITAAELAVCLPLAVFTLTGEKFETWARMYDAMPAECQRHFHVVEAEPKGETCRD